MNQVKIIRNSILSILVGIILSAVAVYCQVLKEPVNYAGGIFILGGMIFLDQKLVEMVFGTNCRKAISLVRLPVYLLISILSLVVSRQLTLSGNVHGVIRAVGIAFLLLPLWKFFSFTTVEEKKMMEQKDEENEV